MSKTSINIKPVLTNSEQHNRREKTLDYVKSELSHLNESFEATSISERLLLKKEKYLETVGQKMQKTATPIREGVVVIDKNTKMEHLQEFGRRCKERFGIEAIQIHIHKDEGHIKAKDFKPNLHAHIVFDFTNDKGISAKLKRLDMVEMQSILAQCLNMERGKTSDKVHLNAIQFKIQEETQRLYELKQENERLNTQNIRLNGTKDVFKGIVSKITKDPEKEALKSKVVTLENRIEVINKDFAKVLEKLEKDPEKANLYEINKNLYRKIDAVVLKSKDLEHKNSILITENKSLNEQMKNIEENLFEAKASLVKKITNDLLSVNSDFLYVVTENKTIKRITATEYNQAIEEKQAKNREQQKNIQQNRGLNIM